MNLSKNLDNYCQSKSLSECKNNLSFEFYTCDETALKTVVRSNPGAIVLKAGNVIDKKHYKDFSYLNFD